MSNDIKVVALNNALNTDGAIKVLEDMIADIRDGTVVAFYAVGVSADDSVRAYVGNAGHVSRLRVIGATYHALARFEQGDV